jgi:4-carboxymuconolactone decarboxylase
MRSKFAAGGFQMNALRIAMVWGIVATHHIVHDAWAQQSTASGQNAASKPSDIFPESRARIPAAKRADFSNDEEKQAFDRIVGRDGGQVPTNATGIRLHFPVVAEHYREANTWLREKAGLDSKFEELAILVAAREANGALEFLAHERGGLAAGVSQEAIDILKQNRDPVALEEQERVIIHLGREMHRAPKVSSKTFADATRLFGQRGTLTIVSLIVHYSASAMLLHAYDVQLAPGQQPPF